MPFTKGHPVYWSMSGKHHSKKSKEKMRKSHLGKKLSEEHKRKIGLAGFGRTVTEETREKISKAQRGEKHYNWKGDKVSYRTLHNWIVKNYGKTNRCEICDGRKAKMFDWHNLSGNYKRERDDWQMLCRSCHMKIDGRTERFGNFLRTVGKGR